MKKLLLFAILIASFTTIYADNIDRNAAYEKAVSFMQQKNPSIRFNKNKARKIVGKTTENTLPYYVFNAESNQGFVIVSGNDQTEPIMGYSENGSFDSDNIPPALQFMLDRYAEELDSINAEEPINEASMQKSQSTRMSTIQEKSYPCQGRRLSRFVRGCGDKQLHIVILPLRSMVEYALLDV